jgi:hypothetical protein
MCAQQVPVSASIADTPQVQFWGVCSTVLFSAGYISLIAIADPVTSERFQCLINIPQVAYTNVGSADNFQSAQSAKGHSRQQNDIIVAMRRWEAWNQFLRWIENVDGLNFLIRQDPEPCKSTSTFPIVTC